MVALNHYNAVLFEDNKVNAMFESVELFEDLINEKWFRRSEVILLLNKDDLFRDKLRVDNIPLSTCFSKEGGWPNEDEYWIYPHFYNDPNLTDAENDQHFEAYHADTITFIEDIYKRRNHDSAKLIYRHVTIATDEKHVEKVFWDVQNIVVRGNMTHAGLISTDPNSNQKNTIPQSMKLQYVTQMTQQHIVNNNPMTVTTTQPIQQTQQPLQQSAQQSQATATERPILETQESDGYTDNGKGINMQEVANGLANVDNNGGRVQQKQNHLPLDSTTVSVDRTALGVEMDEIPHDS